MGIVTRSVSVYEDHDISNSADGQFRRVFPELCHFRFYTGHLSLIHYSQYIPVGTRGRLEIFGASVSIRRSYSLLDTSLVIPAPHRVHSLVGPG